MKKIVFGTLMALIGVVSADPIADVPPVNLKIGPSISVEKNNKQGFVYVQFSAADNIVTNPESILPGLGIGYRRLAGNGAADISVNGIGRIGSKWGSWTFPRASYIHYIQPNAEKSAYVGGGLGWGGVSAKSRPFIGLMPNATLGYEFARREAVLGFAELTVTQPAIPAYQTGAFPGPVAELKTGIGF